MPNAQPTDLQQAADNVNPTEIADNLNGNLKKDVATEQPQKLDNKEQTPFIDDTLRTDKANNS